MRPYDAAWPVLRIVEVLDGRPDDTVLIATAPDGGRHRIACADVADDNAAQSEIPLLCGPLAIRIEPLDGLLKCTCLCRTPQGPQRLRLSMPAALSLLSHGVHGVLATRLPASTASAPDVQR